MAAIGIIFLLQNLNVITGRAWEIIWPIIVILIGVGFFVRHLQGKGPRREDRRRMFREKVKKSMESPEE